MGLPREEAALLEVDIQLDQFQREVLDRDAGSRPLQALSDAYANREYPFNIDDRTFQIREYIAQLLPLEIAFARWRNENCNGRCLPEPETVDCLVMLLGYSWEPLLQSIVVYKPATVLLVVSSTMESASPENAEEFKAIVRNELTSVRLLETVPEFIDSNDLDLVGPTVAERPEAVFRWVQTALQSKRDAFKTFLAGAGVDVDAKAPAVLLDITGAKKSMVAGAYAYAAFADTKVSYVDFDKYDERVGQPLGYSCKITRLENPIELFRVRDWRKAVEHYRYHQFDAAKRLFEGIQKAKIDQTEGKTPQIHTLLFEDEQDAFENLRIALDMYHLWENGDYSGAKDKHKALLEILRKSKKTAQIDAPKAVDELHEPWPDGETMMDAAELKKHVQAFGEGPECLYLHDRRILFYAYDEREKINRLINLRADYRSGFLRAHGLNETLIKARLLRSWHRNELEVQFAGEDSWHCRDALPAEYQSNDDLIAIDRTLGRYDMVPASRLIQKKLKDQDLQQLEIAFPPSKDNENERSRKRNAIFRLAEKAQIMHEFYEGEKQFWAGHQFSGLRNLSIHFCLSLSKELADKAFGLADSNLAEFAGRWATTDGLDVERIKADVANALPEWSALCDVCGLSFLPDLPPTREKSA